MSANQRLPCDQGLALGVRRPSAAPLLTAADKRLALAASIVGSGMAFIDGSVVNVALPAIQKAFAADAAAAQWVMNAYMLLLGALVLIGGAAGDLYGRRRMFLAGVGLFTAASLGCAVAPGVGWLIAARAVQGAGAALLTPASLALLGAVFDEKERGKAIGAWAGFASVTAAAGPVIGGWLTDAASWRAIFLINVPLAAAAVWLTLRAVPESRDPEARALDWRGAILAAAGLALLTWALTEAAPRGLKDPLVAGGLAAGTALLAAFVLVQARSPTPMMPLGLYRSADFSGANGLTFLLYFALGGAFFYLPFALIRLDGYSAAAAGAALLPFSLVMGLFSPAAGAVADRFGARGPLTVGPILAGLGFGLLASAEPGGSYWTGVLPGLAALSAGMTIAVAPLTAVVMGAAGPGRAGVASGINNAVARVAGLLAVAALGAVFAKVFAGALPAASQAAAARTLGRAMAGEAADPAARAAFAHAYRAVMLIAAACAVAAGGVGCLSIRTPRRPQSAA